VIAQLLSGVAWLGGLPPGVREAISSAAYATRHAKGETVSHFGDLPRSWIGVAEGLLKVSRADTEGRGMMLTGVPRGRWIGEAAIVRGSARRYDIVAVRESRLVHIPVATVGRLLEESVAFSRVVLSNLNDRVSQSIEMIEIDRLDDPVARVARTLAAVFHSLPDPQVVPLSQSELGELVGLSRQTVGAALKQLAGEGLVAAGPGRLVLKHVGRLRGYRARQAG
jgi:CRP/FNR family cyclic AMP-dependent transcriptional regulator